MGDVPTGIPEGEYTISVRDIFTILWRRMWVIILVTIVLVGLVVGYDLSQRPVYETYSEVLIGQREGANVAVAPTPYDLQQVSLTMAEAIDSRPIAQAVIERLDLQMGPDELLGNLSAEPIAETQFIAITYTDFDRVRAQRIVNAVGTVFSERVTEISPSASGVTATVWGEAPMPDSPVSPTPARDGVLALVLGAMLGTALAFLLEHLDDRWRSPEEAEQISGVPTFGVIPEFKVPKGTQKKEVY